MKTMKKLLLFFSSLSVALLAACASETKTIHLLQSDNGMTIDANVGDQIVLTLPANPTTGYAWAQEGKQDNTVLLFDSETYSSDDDGLCGAPGISVFTFKAVGPGNAPLKLVYKRPWEKDEVAPQRLDFLIHVEGEMVRGKTPVTLQD